ncbi:MAG: MMPL family transporter [Candidatus Thiodiazotropha sp.]
MNYRLAFATALMITIWAVMAAEFKPSPIPTVEQLLPPDILVKSRQIRDSLSSSTQFTLLNLPRSLQRESRQRLLRQIQDSIPGLRILCIGSPATSESSLPPQLALSDCAGSDANPNDTILFWRSQPKQKRDPRRPLHQEIERKISAILTPAVTERSLLFAPEMVRTASWQAAASDLGRIAPLLGVIVFLVPLLAFRSLTSSAFIFVTAGVTTTATLLLFNTGLEGGFNALLLAVVPLVWAVSSMDAAHLVERIEALERRAMPMPFRRAVRELAAPCSVTTATTFIGFGALAMQSDSPLLRSFGLTAAAGTLLAIVFTFLLGGLLLRRGCIQGRPPYAINPLAALSHGLVRASLNRPVVTLTLWLLLAVAVTPLAIQVSTRTPFPNIFTHDHPVGMDTTRLQQLLDIDLRPLSLYLTAREQSGSNREQLLHALHATTDYVGKLPESRLVLPAAIIKAVCLRGCGDEGGIEHPVRTLIDSSGVARIEVFFRPHDPERQREIISWLEKFDQTMLGHHQLVFDGPGYLYPAVESLGISGALSGILWSLCGVLLILWLVFRRVGLVVPALLVTLLPLWLVVGFMGAVGIDWSLALLGVPAILFGLAVDDTIHLLWHRRRRASLRHILRHNALRSGAALTATTLMLCLSVASLSLSSLIANQEIALLLAIGMALALLLDLTLLPAVVSLLRRKSPRLRP